MESVIFKIGQPLDHIYFPASGVISLLTEVTGGSTLEVGIIGKEGAAGASVMLGAKTSPTHAIVQEDGLAFRLPSAAIDAIGDDLRAGVLRFLHTLMIQISQGAACYRFHPIEQRLARWLLMTSDRMESNEYRITQDFLSDMLGVRREGVNRAAGDLQKKKLISFSRRNIVVIDRPGLEALTCDCYNLIRKEETNSR